MENGMEIVSTEITRNGGETHICWDHRIDTGTVLNVNIWEYPPEDYQHQCCILVIEGKHVARGKRVEDLKDFLRKMFVNL